MYSWCHLRKHVFYTGADPGIPLRVGGFCVLISNFNIYNTKKDQKPKYIVHINKK
jgi:hypothetical protein